MAQTRQPILDVKGLDIQVCMRGAAVDVVNDVNLSLFPGEITGLVGESGCGKSLTGSALLGMLPASTTRLQIDSFRIGAHQPGAYNETNWRKLRGHEIAMIPQDPLTALDPVFTIGSQMIRVIRRQRGASQSVAAERALDLLNGVGMADSEHVLSRYPHELSGGMRQRVMIAMAMSCEPQVLVADEPTTALDVTIQRQILQQIRQLAGQFGTAVLLITHDLAVVNEVCDRMLVMYCGRIIEHGMVSEIIRQPRHPYTAGLLAAVPRADPKRTERVRPIPGTVPAPGHVPEGCSFHDRCRFADTTCRQRRPELITQDQGSDSVSPQSPQPVTQHYACHHPLNQEAIR